MKLSLSAVLNVLCATAVLAAPRDSGLARRIARRQGKPMVPSKDGLSRPSNATHAAEFSSNWSGAVLTSPPAGQTFSSAVGTFTVPNPTPPTSSGTGTWSSSAWVGIDGDTCQSAILQSGLDFTVTRNSRGTVTTSFDSWFEWFPNFATDFSGFSVSAGNQIEVSIVATSLSAGKVTLTNLSTGKSVSQSLTAPSSSAHLCGTNAEWIVEDFEEGNSLVPLSNFGTVVFTGASAKTASSTLSVSGAQIINMRQGSTVLTNVSIPSSSSVQVQFI